MEIKGSHIIAAPVDTVWRLMNDPAVLQSCVPGCQDLFEAQPGVYKTKVLVKFGPITAKFAAKIRKIDEISPESLTLIGEHKGKQVSVTKLQFEENDGTTKITYQVDTRIGGKFTWLGDSHISKIAEKLANEFFESFTEVAV
jgi:uncharacterized protein